MRDIFWTLNIEPFFLFFYISDLFCCSDNNEIPMQCWTHFIGIISLYILVHFLCYILFWYYLSQLSVTDIRIRSNDLLFSTRSTFNSNSSASLSIYLWLDLIRFLCVSLLFTCYLSRCLLNKSQDLKRR